MQTESKPGITHRRGLELAVLLLIVAVGIGSRFWLVDIPNFKPIAGLCLFGGFFFRNLRTSLIAVWVTLLISDWLLGAYHWQVALSVYGSLTIACGLGWLIRVRLMTGQAAYGLSLPQVVAFGLASLLMSTVFFGLTNAAVWAFCGWYPTDGQGLIACFTAAVPFYRWTLIGDLTFTMAILASYQFVCVLLASRQELTTQVNA